MHFVTSLKKDINQLVSYLFFYDFCNGLIWAELSGSISKMATFTER